MIDKMSLGGEKYKDKSKVDYLKEISPTYCKYYEVFRDKPKELINKITSFFYDLDQTLQPLIIILILVDI